MGIKLGVKKIKNFIKYAKLIFDFIIFLFNNKFFDIVQENNEFVENTQNTSNVEKISFKNRIFSIFNNIFNKNQSSVVQIKKETISETKTIKNEQNRINNISKNEIQNQLFYTFLNQILNNSNDFKINLKKELLNNFFINELAEKNKNTFIKNENYSKSEDKILIKQNDELNYYTLDEIYDYSIKRLSSDLKYALKNLPYKHSGYFNR